MSRTELPISLNHPSNCLTSLTLRALTQSTWSSELGTIAIGQVRDKAFPTWTVRLTDLRYSVSLAILSAIILSINCTAKPMIFLLYCSSEF